MSKKIIFGITLTLLLMSILTLGLSASSVLASLSVHNIDTGEDFAAIQEAIDDSDTLNGHTIFVEAGTYYENVTIDKSISLIGEDKDTTVIDGNGSLRVVAIYSDEVSISGFTVMHSYGELGQGGGGLVVGGVGNVQISDIIACDNDADWGVHLNPDSHDVNITRTVIVNNSRGGLMLHGTWKVKVSNNIITNNAYWAGVRLQLSSNNTVSGNRIANNEHGIDLLNASTNTISENNITNNGYGGIYLEHSLNNIISGNYIANNDDGIVIRDFSDCNIVCGNNITNNFGGVEFILWCYNNIIYGNNITNNVYGFWISYSSDNFFYHNNIINNTHQVSIVASLPWQVNAWNNSYPSGGNYWSDHVCTGNPSNGSQPYIIDENNIDHYPFQDPNGWLLHQLTVTSSPITGIPFTIDGTPKTTPYTEWLLSGSYTLEMPETYNGYVWSHWLENGDPNRTKTITLLGTTWTGVFVFAVQPHGPEAEFTATPDTASIGDSIKLDASASLPGWNGTHEMPITEYRWDFGGAIKITTSSPILYYSFISPGIYNATLTVYAPGATPETDTTSREVTITSLPIGGYSLPTNRNTTTKPLMLYIILAAILTSIFATIKRERHRRTKRS